MSNEETRIEYLADFFKALSHPVRLLVLHLVKEHPRHGEELASILWLNPATISHHLGILTRAGLVTSKKDQYYQVYSLDRNFFDQKLGDLVFTSKSRLPDTVKEDAYQKKVLATFFYRGRLKSIPVQLKKRQIILSKIADSFEPEREYSEREVNIILVDFHDDVAALRRGLVEFGFMKRSQGQYTRHIDPEFVDLQQE